MKRVLGMYCSARLYVVYSVGTPKRPLDATLRNADDHPAMVVELEIRAYGGIFELVEFGVGDRDEGILGKNVLDRAL